MKHVLEHLTMTDVPRHLAWCFGRLVPGGRLIIDGPDLRSMCRALATKPTWAWDDVAMIYGGQRSAWDFHRAGWGPDFLSHLLTDAGFTHIDWIPVDLCFVMEGHRPLEVAR
jgi:predicted SAM-dependent methyltransferase